MPPPVVIESVVAPPPLAPAATPASVEPAPARATSDRPKLTMSAAVGVSIDNLGIADGRNVVIPSFAVLGGIGQDLFGFEARLFASEAAGRFSSKSSADPTNMGPIADVGADRQGLDVLLAIRPFANGDAARDWWTARFVRALTIDVGFAVERVSVGTQAVERLGGVLGGHFDLPLTPPGESSELRLTISVRRMQGLHKTIDLGDTHLSIGNSKVEAFAGLAVVF